ncbi:MAG: 2-oxoacid:acceptor oxidoreductase family protein [Thermoleophilia bacterium]
MPRRRLEIVLAGFGGQGVMVMGQLLAYAAMNSGLEVTWMPSYGPEQRGGTANCTVVISTADIASPIVARPHVAVVMNTPSYEKFEPRVVPHGALLVNSSLVPERSFRTDIDVFYVPAVEVAGKLGNERMANIVMVGALAAATGALPREPLLAELSHFFEGDKARLLDGNRRALRQGFNLIPREDRHPLFFAVAVG